MIQIFVKMLSVSERSQFITIVIIIQKDDLAKSFLWIQIFRSEPHHRICALLQIFIANRNIYHGKLRRLVSFWRAIA